MKKEKFKLTMEHLCDTCTHKFATCGATEIIWGSRSFVETVTNTKSGRVVGKRTRWERGGKQKLMGCDAYCQNVKKVSTKQ